MACDAACEKSAGRPTSHAALLPEDVANLIASVADAAKQTRSSS